jgi:hypothetical protein
VCLLGGSSGIREIFDFALAIEFPALPLPFAGGTSKEAWTSHQELVAEEFGIKHDPARDPRNAWTGFRSRCATSRRLEAPVDSRPARVHEQHAAGAGHETPIDGSRLAQRHQRIDAARAPGR